MTNEAGYWDGKNSLLSLYGIVFETLRHEGNGIWQRFNILIGINLALFAGVGFFCFSGSRPASWQGFAIAISSAGIFMAISSFYVLRKLWERHWHWRNCLENLQKTFPTEWERPIDCRQPLLINLTDYYLVVLLLAWIALFTVVVACPGTFSSV